MEIKYLVTISGDKMMKRLEINGKSYEETWNMSNGVAKTDNECILEKLENDSEGCISDELYEALVDEDFYEMWTSPEMREDY